jgi:AcrR family transcriptional regulator
MSDRKDQILQTAIEIIATEGYGKLTMRALARASDMKLGALQYHFPTWADLLQALANYIGTEYQQSFDIAKEASDDLKLRDFVAFLLDDEAGGPLRSDRLWPQLWAMAQVEPLLEEQLNNIYSYYIKKLEQLLVNAGSPNPRAEALTWMSMIEGATLFVGSQSQWADDAAAMRATVLDTIDTKYGKQE